MVTLTESHRCASAVARAIAGVARRLPGADAPRGLAATDERPGSVAVRIAASPHAESALIADALRRAHLVDGVPWSQMAVIVRSVPRAGAALSRALTAAGVPVELPLSGAPLAEQPAVRALLTVLDATAARADRRAGAVAVDGAHRPGRSRRLCVSCAGRCAALDASRPPREFADLLTEALDTSPASGRYPSPPGSRRHRPGR